MWWVRRRFSGSEWTKDLKIEMNKVSFTAAAAHVLWLILPWLVIQQSDRGIQ